MFIFFCRFVVRNLCMLGLIFEFLVDFNNLIEKISSSWFLLLMRKIVLDLNNFIEKISFSWFLLLMWKIVFDLLDVWFLLILTLNINIFRHFLNAWGNNINNCSIQGFLLIYSQNHLLVLFLWYECIRLTYQCKICFQIGALHIDTWLIIVSKIPFIRRSDIGVGVAGI